MLNTLTPNKSYAYLLNVEQSNMKTYNSGFDEVIITFTNQNSRLLKTEYKVNFTIIAY